MLILDYDDNKYKKLRYITENYREEEVAIRCSTEILESDTSRYIFYSWNKLNKFYYVIEDLNKVQLSNFINNKDFFAGVIISIKDISEIQDKIDIIRRNCINWNKDFKYMTESELNTIDEI